MASQPWYRKQNSTWYITVAGSQVSLGKDKATAFHEWHKMEAAGDLYSEAVRLDTIAESFLEWCSKHRTQQLYEWYRRYLVDLCNAHGDEPVRKLKRHHFTRWLDDKAYSKGNYRAAITAAKRCLNWAVEEGLIEVNPAATLRRPSSGRREVMISSQQLKDIIESADRGYAKQWRRGAFRAFVLALANAGCRPSEVAKVTAAHYDARLPAWVFSAAQNKTGEVTGRHRVVYLNACLDTLTRILASARPSGPLFLNARRQAWTQNAVRTRMRRLRAKLGLPDGMVSYSFRHTYTTDALVNGVDSETVAEMLGHSSTAMLRKHYAHLDQRKAHMRDAAQRATKRTRTDESQNGAAS